MKDDPLAFPDARIRSTGEVSARFRELGIDDLRAAIRFVRDLPYGRPDDRDDPLAVLEEGIGTCSTKHALLARLCVEQGIAGVRLTLGVYEMTEENTPGVGPVLEAAGLDYLPEAHCYLRHDGDRFDFTTADDDGTTVDRFLVEEPIRPEQVGQYKTDRHRAYLADWVERRELDAELDELWRIRERCIERLSR